MARMSQASGGLLPPLCSLVGQKRISPAGLGSRDNEEDCHHDPQPSIGMLNGFVISQFPAEEKQAACVEDSRKLERTTPGPKEILSVEEFSQKERADGVNGSGTGPQNTFTKSLQKAEALLRNRFNPGLKWLLKQRSDGSCFDPDCEYSFIAGENHSSERLVNMEQCFLGLSKRCHVLRSPKSCSLHGHIKELSADSSLMCKFCFHPVHITVNKHYGKLQSLFEQRSQLLFFYEYTKRLKVVSDFVARLSKLLGEEQKLLKRLMQDSDSAWICPEYKISSLCEELRSHTSHWDCLYDKARNDNWLRPILFQKKESLGSMKRTLNLLGIQTIILLERYINTVLHVLALVKPVDVSAELIEDIFRGTEIFNCIESNTSMKQKYYELQKSCESQGVNESELLLLRQKTIVSVNKGKGDFKPFPVIRILRILSKQRGQLAANRLYNWIINQNSFLSNVDLSSCKCLDWENVKVPFLQNTSKCNSKATKTGLSRPKLGERQQSSCTGAQTHPLSEILKEDEEFMDKVLLALVSSTKTLGHHVLNRPKPDKPHQHVDCIPANSPDSQICKSVSDLGKDMESGREGEISSTKKITAVQWQDSMNLEVKGAFFSQYRTMLWNDFGAALLNLFYQPRYNGILGSLNQCKDQMAFLVVKELHSGCRKALMSRECDEVIRDLCLQLISKAAFMHWDQVLCKALGTGLKDKCLLDPEKEGTCVKTRTTELLQQLFHPLAVILNCLDSDASRNKGNCIVESKPAFTSLNLSLLSYCASTVHSCSYWVMTKAYQYLSSWSLNQFLLVTQGDLKLLKAEVERLVLLVEALNMEERSSPALHDALIQQQEKAVSTQVIEAAANMRAFSENVLKIFSMDCKKMSEEIFEQTMPVGKHWRVNCKTVLPSSPSEYAASAAQSVIGLVLEGIQPLPDDGRIPALTEAMTAFMEAWMDHILKQKIKFSIQGALQLKQDFDMVRDLIKSEKYSLSEEIRQRLLSMRVFHQVDNAIICLLQQPTSKAYIPSRTWEPFRRCCSNNSRTRDFGSGNLNSLESLDLQAARNNAIVQAENSMATDLLGKIMTSGNPESYLAVKQQEWLALRIHNGNRWKILRFPCMTRTSEQ
ncbi:uncharacterized protein ccdc142 isoform X1 [Polyodon spathula]|uniref:uncharacterized protein ccdc142 isoform X1 n=1 Tax=Polyodon spathula TaxID=7913 RepID=UPI001B7E55C8|nr:uncharacterized protein ccdc142 isoform X1 [Polyodon spathula]